MKEKFLEVCGKLYDKFIQTKIGKKVHAVCTAIALFFKKIGKPLNFVSDGKEKK